MKEHEQKLGTTTDQKSKIRERYKGVDIDSLDVIPAIPQEDFYSASKIKRVAVYARVSTDDPRQTSSYELQKNHYTDMVSRREDWNLVEIYADEGISGTSLQHRDSFIKMIADCKAGKIDLIVTKSVSRFARNVLDCIGYVRQLAAMTPPIGVFFETENIYTLNPNSEMSLSFISTLAQEESHTKSEIMNASIEMRFKRGIFLTPPLLGYDQDEDGNLVINEDEARIVRLIFFMYLYGYTCQEIADTLTKLRCRTKKGNTHWSHGSVLQILQNERHCGDVLARKTFTPNYLDHKSKKNNKDRNQYRMRNHHESIISRDDFIAVQRLINNAKYGNKGILPELHVIMDGVLKGFVPINPRWAGFKPNDYYTACQTAYSDIEKIPSAPLEIKAQSGDFDFRGYEIARGQFFDTANKIGVSFTSDSITFTTEAIRKFNNASLVELLIHPTKKLFAVRPCQKDNRNAVKWIKIRNENIAPRTISGAAYLPTLFKLLGWNTNHKHRIMGVCRQRENDIVLIFNLKDTEIILPAGAVPQENDEHADNIKPLITGGRNSVIAYPAEWSNHFGDNYYQQMQASEVSHFDNHLNWDINTEGQPYKEPDIQTTDIQEVKREIHEIITELKENQHAGNSN